MNTKSLTKMEAKIAKILAESGPRRQRNTFVAKVNQVDGIMSKLYESSPGHLSSSEEANLARMLDAISFAAAYLSRFVETRDPNAARKKETAVRKALGYTYP